MKITLLITTFNSISQLIYVKLKDLGFIVDVVYAINKIQMISEVEEFKPNIILSPFLKKYIPKEIFTKYPTFIFHPGPLGDRGAFSLDWAIKNGVTKWGVTILRANEKYDSGDIYYNRDFKVISTKKASLYRNEIFNEFSEGLEILLNNLKNLNFKPTKQFNTPMHKRITQQDRSIDWKRDTTREIIKKINFSDSFPGVLDNILGIKCYLFGVWEEEKLKGDKPKKILAKRDGAICISTIDGAVWITHLKEVGRFKLPSTYVLKDRIKGIKEERLPLIFDRSYKTFYEINVNIEEEIAYLYFNFHNGAFRSEQSIRLKYAIEYLKEKVKVIVLMGGEDFFSNGINLNILEDSKKSGEDGWSNINAINDLIKSIIFSPNNLFVAGVKKNAGAGGVFLATACDFIIASKNTILNPHYKTIGLSGSEYHTFTLPKRVGEIRAKELLNKSLPISADYAKKIGLLDEVFEVDNYEENLKNFCKNLISNEDKFNDMIWDKQNFLEENEEKIEKCKENELKIMHPEFWEKDSIFHKLRREFVYKICPNKTPKRLKYRYKKEL